MKTEGIVWLEKIKDGSISEHLKEYSELEKMKIIPSRKLTLDNIIYFNKGGRLPRLDHLSKSTGFNKRGIIKQYNKCFRKNELAFDITIPELFYVFSYYKGTTPTLPNKLISATWNDLSKFRSAVRRGSIKSWNKKLENPRATIYSRYCIALVSENKKPVFRSAFSFLPYLQTEPLSV